MSLNSITLTGRLTFEPEIKATSSGVSVVRFCIAVDRNYQPKGEERKTDFIDCVAWRGTAEFVGRYFKKGDMIAVTGELQTENYTDKNGNNRKSVNVVVSNVSFCGGKNQTTTYVNADNNEYEEIIDDDDDLPF